MSTTIRRPSSGVTEWRTSTRSGGEDVEWFPILELGPTGQLIGITREAEWLTTRKDGSVTFPSADIDGKLSLLRLVELNSVIFREVAVTTLSHLGFDQSLIDNFPTSDLIKFALETHSGYWGNYALDWMEEFGCSRDHLPALQSMIDDRRTEQKLRHRARRILRRSVRSK